MTKKRRGRVMILVEGGDPAGHGGEADWWSGPARYWVGAITELRETGYEIVYGTLRSRSPLHPMVEDLGCSTFSLRAGTAISYPLAALRLRRLLGRLEIDLLHASESIQGAVGGLSALASKHRVVFHRHHALSVGPSLPLSRAAGRWADLTMAVSRSAADAAVEEGTPGDRIEVAHNGIAALRDVSGDEVANRRKELQIAEGGRIIVVVGHLRPEKGHRILLQALERIDSPERKSTHLVVVGQGPEKETLEKLAGSLPEGNNVHFVGHQSDVATWFHLADVVAIPSFRESFGLVAIEAMSCARPVVASSVGGLAEIIEPGRSGLLVSPGDPAALASSLQRVLDSPTVAGELAQRGRALYERTYTLQTMVAGWDRCYQIVLPGGR